MRRGRKRWIEGGRRVEKEGGREGGEGGKGGEGRGGKGNFRYKALARV